MLKKYLIERDLPGIGRSSPEEFSQLVHKAMDAMGSLELKRIVWRESFVTEDKIYCVYLAESEDILREHARLGGFSVDVIREIRQILDPATTFDLPRWKQSAADINPPLS